MRRWLGIDFSGNHKMWRAGLDEGNVWIAHIAQVGDNKKLSDRYPVQELPGAGSPFQNLVDLLKRRDFEAAAIDAPFSVPFNYLSPGGHRKLLESVAQIEKPSRWPFPSGADFVCRVLDGRPLLNTKPLRKTERLWRDKRINVRSTLWNGPRPGAPMTSACLTLLHEAGCPIWPWDRSGPGLLVEAFPAAQLCQWKMLYQGYGKEGDAAASIRKILVSQLSARIALTSFEKKLEESADALDAVLCAFAAFGVTTDNLADVGNGDYPLDEGLIAVCR